MKKHKLIESNKDIVKITRSVLEFVFLVLLIFGMWFCLYYEAVLLWQMPVAWVTFWKSTWGTRMTPADLKEMEKEWRKKERKEKKQHEP